MRRIEVSKLIEALPEVSDKLRASGFRVGTSQVVEAARLLEAYAALKRATHLPLDEAAFVVASALSMPGNLDTIMDAIDSATHSSSVKERFEAIERGIVERLEKAGLKPGQRVSRKKIAGKGKGRRERIAAYLDLKKVGVISRIQGVERVAGRQEITRLAWRLASQGYESLEDAVRSASPLHSKDDLALQAYAGLAYSGDLKRMPTGSLLKLARWASEHRRRRVLEEVAEELARRIRSGHSVGSEALKYLNEAGILGPLEEAAVLARRPGDVDVSLLDPSDVARLASSLEEERAAQLVAKALRESRSEEYAWSILENVDVHILWEVGRNPLKGVRRRLLDAAVEASKSLREAVTYLETGLEGHADMAEYLAESALAKLSGIPRDAGGGKLTPTAVESTARAAKVIVVAARSGEADRLAAILAGLDPEVSLRILRGMYRRGGMLRDRSIELAEKLLEKLSSIAGSRLLPKYVQTSSMPGRLMVRESIYRILRRSPEPLVFRRKLKARQLSMALDVSGSMSRYSVWALAIALPFSRNIKDLILFSHKIEKLRSPLTPRDVAAALMSAEFAGFTDIYGALMAAADAASKRLVVVTDLKQTVNRGDVSEAVRELRARGFRVVFIVPPVHDHVERESVEAAGARVRVAFKPEDAAREVLYALRR